MTVINYITFLIVLQLCVHEVVATQIFYVAGTGRELCQVKHSVVSKSISVGLKMTINMSPVR